MIDMKRAVVFVVLGGLSLTGAFLGGYNRLPAQAAELNGFAINTQDKDKAVTITLFTDQRVPYATEHQGKQFTIVLPNTQVSPEQLKNGLPVVIDNKNHFIGRAIPTGDGKVKIILPNLPASDYAVSIQQKHVTAKTDVDSATKPRPAISLTPTSQFEQVVASIPKAAVNRPTATKSNTDSSVIKLSPTAHRLIERGPNTRNIIWNPYATKAPARVSVAHEPTPASKAISLPAEAIHLKHVASPVITETELPAESATAGQAGPAKDALWYLHSLPPASPNGLPTTDLKTLAAQDAITQAAIKSATAEAKKPEPQARTNYTRGLLRELKDGFKSIPQWLLITLAVFMGGIGIFTLFGGLVLLKILFVQARTQIFTQPLPAEAQGHPNLATASGNQPRTEKGSYATRPGHGRGDRYDFEDKSSVSALDYLKGSPDSVAKAVHNTTLLRFPTQRKHHNGFRKPAGLSGRGGTPTYSVSP